MNKCCVLYKFPKKYLYIIDGRQWYVNGKVHFQIKKFLKENPGAELSIKDISNE
jgi:hypothetical protein